MARIEYGPPGSGQYLTVPDDATDDQINELVKRAANQGRGPVARTLTDVQEAYATNVREPVRQALARAGEGYPEWATPWGGNPYQLAAEFVPENIGTVAGTAASGVGGKLVGKAAGAMATSPAGQAGYQVLLNAIKAAAPAYVLDELSGQGERALPDALSLGLGAGAGTAAGLVGRGARRNLFSKQQSQEDVGRLAGAVGPQMGAPATPTGTQLGEAVFLKSRGARQAAMEEAEQGLNAAIPGAPASVRMVPQQTPSSILGPSGQPQTTTQMVPQQIPAVPSATERLAEIRLLKEEQRKAYSLGKFQGPEGSRALGQQAADKERALLAEAAQIDPAAAAKYEAAIPTYRAHITAEDFLKDAKLWNRDAEASPNMQQMKAKLLQRWPGGGAKSKVTWIEHLKDTGNDDLVEAIAREGSPLAQDVTHTLSIGGALGGYTSTAGPRMGMRAHTGGLPLSITTYSGGPGQAADTGLESLIGTTAAMGLRRGFGYESMDSPEVQAYMRRRRERNVTGGQPNQ